MRRTSDSTDFVYYVYRGNSLMGDSFYSRTQAINYARDIVHSNGLEKNVMVEEIECIKNEDGSIGEEIDSTIIWNSQEDYYDLYTIMNHRSDSKQLKHNNMKRIKDSREGVEQAIQDWMYESNKEYIDINDIYLEYYGEDRLLVATAELDRATAYIFKSEEDAEAFVAENYGADFITGVTSDEGWIDILSSYIEREEAEQIVASQDWQEVADIMLEEEGPEWVLSPDTGGSYYYGDYVIYY
jgi:hypothetical protein